MTAQVAELASWWVVRWSCQKSDLYRARESFREKKAEGELVEVVAVGLTGAWFPRGGVPATAAEGLCSSAHRAGWALNLSVVTWV